MDSIPIESAGGGAAVSARRRRALVELGVGYGLILVVIWTPRPWQRVFYIAALAWIAWATWRSFDGWRVMGLRLGGLGRSLWVVGVALVLAVVAVAVAARLGTLKLPPGVGLFVTTYWGYAIWSLVQQFLLQDFVLLRVMRLVSSKRAAVMVAVGMFGLAHLPSPILTVVTVVWGTAACWLFLRYRNIYTLGMAHAVFGICLAVVVPGRVDHNMRVGLGYLRYHPRGMRHLNQRDHRVSTAVWVTAEVATRRF